MKNLTKNLIILSLFAAIAFPFAACTKTEKTTVIKEDKPADDKDRVEVKIDGNGVDIEVDADKE